jgi:ubiquinol-cytochrome c reductase cytochrome b/c1 subunit
MAKTTTSTGNFQKLKSWIDYRLPIFSFLEHSAHEYPTPKNLNYMWNFGSLAGITLTIMIISGIWLAMQYTPHVNYAFESVERIMRDVNGGWFLRYLHMNGASMFFIAVYLHMVRGLYYGSYKNPRELLWIIGVLIFILMMATAFMGYVLPWGQMSFWGATVITNLFAAIPVIGDGIVELLWGGFSVDNPTLNRFFALHFLLPFIILAVVIMHIVSLHQHGSNNPTGIDPKPNETIPFHPYYTSKDILGLGIFLLVWMFFIFFKPNFFGEADNYIPANPLVTPEHIVPEWYFLPYYAILRSVPDKLGGVILMFSSVLILFIVPWLDTSKIKSSTYRPLYRNFFWLFVIACLSLGWAGGQSPEGIPLLVSRIATLYYFTFFLVIMPILSKIEKNLPDLPKKPEANPQNPTLTSTSVSIILTIITSITITNCSYGNEAKIPKQKWGFEGFTGKFDNSSLRRGFQIYKEVCSTCHQMSFMSYRNLQGMGYSDDVIKAFAAEGIVIDGPNDEGEMFERQGRPSDKFPQPYPNEKAARAANNGAYPVDLSLITSARNHGPDYLFALLTGYKTCPEDFQLYPGMIYNEYFNGKQIAMPPPLSEDVIEYQDGTKATVDQMARDVTEFLFWATNPHMEKRKSIGIKVILFLTIFSGIMYIVNNRIWKNVKK